MKVSSVNISILILFLCFLPVSAQNWYDDFSDGDFVTNPPWQGIVDHFTVDGEWLRLNAPAATNISFLAAPSDIVTDASWEFVFRTNFRPTSANYAKVYLLSDTEVLNSPLNGYFLRLGHTSRDICLFRQNGSDTDTVRLITGRANVFDATSNLVRILVTRSSDGLWTLSSDLEGGRNFTVDGSAPDSQNIPSAFFGVLCRYTATRSKGFWFGDFRVEGQPYTDNDPPTVRSHVLKERQIQIDFTEPVADVSTNFLLLDDRIHIEEVHLDTPSRATLLLSDDPACGLPYNFTVSGIADVHGNVMRDTVLFFSVPCRANPLDIVINEIMADPTPSVYLPEYEYIELFNRSDKNIDLEGWTFSYGNSVRTFPHYLFPAGSYLLLCHLEAVTALSTFGSVLPVLHSATAITNTGQYLQLADRDGTVISWVDFTADWYADALKSDGGWAIEQINPDLPCSVAANWKATSGRNGNGGTPGQSNSVKNTTIAVPLPEIFRIDTPDEHTVLLHVSNPIEINIFDLSQFVMNPEIQKIELVGKHFNCLQISLNSPMQQGQWYDLSINGSVTDCAGQQTPVAQFHFAMPQRADSLDVIINEILFNPVAGSHAFVEIYNRSQKALQAADLLLSMRTADGYLSAPVPLTAEPFLLLPGQYLAISRNAAAIMQQYPYPAAGSAAFLTMPAMPGITRSAGRIVLLDKSLHIIDELPYSADLHTAFLQLSSGVSLERIHPDRSSIDPTNWQTAAQTEGFGTPGHKNSQYISVETIEIDEVKLGNEVFTPDNDGFDDTLIINYNFGTSGMIANLIIFDSTGRMIRRLASQQLIDTQGAFIWDGANDRGQRASIGIHVVLFQAYNAAGTQKSFKLPCVLAAANK